MSVKKSTLMNVFAGTLTLLAAGCTYSDYPGHPGHKTYKEAYVPSWGTVISGWDENWDGTYVYTVKYNHQKWMKRNYKFDVKITSYRNPVKNSNPHRPNIFPSGTGFSGATGFSGGTFSPYWVTNDRDPKVVGGMLNMDKSQPLDSQGKWISPGMLLVSDIPKQEVDAYDWDLQSGFKNASQLLGSIIANGGSLENLDLGINALTIGQEKFTITPFTIGFSINGSQNQILIKNQPAAKPLIKVILENTPNMKPVKLVLHFENGMEIATPKGLSVMFNHKALEKFAQ
jgi:hypothetical protein